MAHLKEIVRDGYVHLVLDMGQRVLFIRTLRPVGQAAPGASQEVWEKAVDHAIAQWVGKKEVK